MSIEGQWGTSRDGESYSGAFGTREEAIAEREGDRFVGQYRSPILEEAIEAEDLIEKVLCQDDYCGDWADGSLDATPEQLAELTAIIRRELVAWVDRHGLRPTFGVVEHSEEIAKEE